MVENFLKELKSKGWKLKEIAEKIDLKPSFLSTLYHGGNCSLETAIKLADAFGVTLDEVTGRADPGAVRTPVEDMILKVTAGNDDIARAALRSAEGEKQLKAMEGKRGGKKAA